MSRQFVDMSRTRIEGLFAAFPKIMGGHEGKGSSSGGSGGGQVQHTFVETDSVRWVTIEYSLLKKRRNRECLGYTGGLISSNFEQGVGVK